MPTGFIYVVNTVERNYAQRGFSSIPTAWGGRLYFGPCKRAMRPKVREGDFIFGVSPARTPTRRFVFATQVEESIDYKEAHKRFPELHGPAGPIHVKPVQATGAFPYSNYQHIPGAIHADEWVNDLATFDHDRFFVCAEPTGWLGRWLGQHGPAINGEILAFLKRCPVYGKAKKEALGTNSGTLKKPIAHGKLYTGLHLETNRPEKLIALCNQQMIASGLNAKSGALEIPQPLSSKSGQCYRK